MLLFELRRAVMLVAIFEEFGQLDLNDRYSKLPQSLLLFDG
jgi:hypothetical protein